MVILGEMTPDMSENPFRTSYVDFYSSMMKVPLFAEHYNRIMPFFILLFGGLFMLLSFFKYQNKALAAFNKVNKTIESKIKAEEKLQVTSASSKTKPGEVGK